MRKVIAAINMTIDGNFDHTKGLPDEEVHEHYTELLQNADSILYGRITYQLMQYWQPFIMNPSGKKSMDDFAIAINSIPKIVFSTTLQDTGWKSASLANESPEIMLKKLKQESGKDILIGSRSLIIQLLQMDLIDEFQLCIFPVIAGGGLSLFERLHDRIQFKLIDTKTFTGGSLILYYQPSRIKTD